MLKYIALGLLLTSLAGCQPPAPESVANSQVPPSAAVRLEVVRVIESANETPPGNILKPQISSVVLLDPETNTYAFCVRAANAKRQGQPEVIGISMREGKLIGSTMNEYRCRDSRLRYYDFPELLALMK